MQPPSKARAAPSRPVLAAALAGLLAAASLHPAAAQGAAESAPPALSHALTPAREARPAPPLRLQDLDGKPHDLADIKGKVVLVNFWATWCPPCRREMPSLERLVQNLKGTDFVALAVDVGEDADTVFAFLGQLEPAPSFPMLLDLDSRAMQNWPVRGLPTTYLVDRQGRIAYSAIGGREFDHPEIEAAIRALLAK
ncbi:MAG: TlpA family protein disulfide reductase [Thiobacillaceae bacterium]|jgi:thiol-disulfide isomerase/thioredoxin|nr:TlpA family protein disulfide reductase [Thiobacillaceae bacterium]